jgi:hypothetical protein
MRAGFASIAGKFATKGSGPTTEATCSRFRAVQSSTKCDRRKIQTGSPSSVELYSWMDAKATCKSAVGSYILSLITYFHLFQENSNELIMRYIMVVKTEVHVEGFGQGYDAESWLN